jgi:hypothetical protein
MRSIRIGVLLAFIAGVSLVAVPSASAGQPGRSFHGISCPASTFCYFVGASGQNPLIESWDDHHWVARVPSTPGVLNAVSCVSTTECVAVGGRDLTPGEWVPYIEVFRGGTWSVRIPPHAAHHLSMLFSVSCSSAAECRAIGWDSTSQSGFAETLNGNTWTYTPNVEAHSVACVFGLDCVSSRLDAISCLSFTSCVATGDLGNPGQAAAQILRGGTWFTTAAPPLPSGTTTSALPGVGCTAATACLAVGSYTSRSVEHPLAEIWDGNGWARKVVAAPDGSAFEAVSCPGIDLCIVAGTNHTTATATAQVWNGIGWSALSPL